MSVLRCPVCNVRIDESLENVFNHLRFQHDDLPPDELLIATLEGLAQMNLDSYYRKVETEGQKGGG